MSTVAPVIKYYVVPSRGARESLITSPDNPVSATVLGSISLVRATKVGMEFRFYQDTSTGDVAVLDYGPVSVYLSARKQSLAHGDILFKVGPCVRVQNGDDIYYAGTVSLNQPTLRDALYNDESVQILCEVYVEGGTDALQTRPSQFEATLYDRVLDTEDTAPTSPDMWPDPATASAAISGANIAAENADAKAALAEAKADEVDALIGGIHFDGTKLVINGEESPDLKGPKGDTGNTGAAGANGSLLGTAGFKPIASAGTLSITSANAATYNGTVIEFTGPSGTLTIELADSIPTGFACEAIAANAGCFVAYSLAAGSTKTLKQADNLTTCRKDGAPISVRTGSTKHYLGGDFA